MEKGLVLKGEIRERTGSKSSVKVRKQGRIPAVVYGHKKETVAVSLDAHNLVEGLHHGSRVFDIQIGKKKETVMFKNLQYDYLGRDIIHVDLVRVDVTETVKIKVPIELKGTAQGTHEGGIIEEHVAWLEVECMVTDIPETIAVWVKDLGIGQALHAGEVELPEKVKLVSDTNIVLVTCSLVAAAKAAEEIAEEEEPIDPEVISEAKEGEEEKPEAEKGKS